MKTQILILLFISFGTCKPFESDNIPTIPNPDFQYLLDQVVSTVKVNHYKPKSIDDAFSQQFFKSYLSVIDSEKLFFTQNDIKQLETLEFTIDNELQAGTFTFFEKAFYLRGKAEQQVIRIIEEILKKKIDYTVKESMETNPDKLEYARNHKELKERWRLKIKQGVLEELYLINVDINNADFKQKEKEAAQRVKMLIEVELKQRQATSKEQRFHQYLNTFLQLQDAQSGFLSVDETSKWREKFTRSLVGVGIRFEIINGYPKVMESTIGGPAWKSQQIKKGDIILKIGASNKTLTDVFGKTSSEVISLLKGEKGTTVFLTMKKISGEKIEVPIIREEIRFDLAMSLLLNDRVNEKIGYIRLPRFYTGEEGAAYHVSNEIDKLMANKAEGIILDLRFNIGGSARETTDIIGYFLKEGIVMRMNSRDNGENEIEDTDGIAKYPGDLIVLVNERSASGSELLAGTLQDFGRAVIVGGKSTYGKGTRQMFFNFEKEGQAIGSSKMTVGTFFTATGRSPQYTGVIPDIQLPNDFKYRSIGERVADHPLPPENLTIKTCHQDVNVVPQLETLKNKSEKRVKENARFQLAEEKALNVQEKYAQSSIDLHFDAFKKRKLQEQIEEEKFNNIFTEIKNFKVELLPQDALSSDTRLIESNKNWQNKIQQDPYIYECFQIMNDMLES